MHPIRLSNRLVVVVGCALISAGCGSKKPTGNPNSWPDGYVSPEVGIFVDSQVQDLGAAPDGLQFNANGPVIEIVTPKDKETVTGELVKVTAKITDPDGLDDQSIKVTAQGGAAARMSITTTPDTYEGLVDITQFRGTARIWITAADLQGNGNTAIRDFQRDPGPSIEFISPEADSRHKGSLTIQVAAADKVAISTMEVKLGKTPLTLAQKSIGTNRFVYSATIKFDDPMFGLELTGKQVLTATAENQNKAKSTAQRVFFIDDEGPSIVVKTQKPGDLIGGLIAIQATVIDLAGVHAPSVRCVIGNEHDNRTVFLKPSPVDPTTFEGQFDTKTLSQYDLWPVMSFRAADKLNNESHQDIEVALDNGKPILELDPPINFYMGREKPDGTIECSHPFDPLGDDAADDKDLVPQILSLRVRIEDQGNHVPSAPFIPFAKVDPATTKMFILDDTSRPVVVDNSGDGYCDIINPEIIPLGSQPQPDEAVAVNIIPITPTGSADFTPWGSPFPFSICKNGIDLQPPKRLCDISNLITVIPGPSDSTEPVIYSIPPVIGGDRWRCLGIPFDFRANQFDEGWVCVAATAKDHLGNEGVSMPLRLWYDAKAITRGTPPSNAGAAPDCTGTLVKATGKVDASKPCLFRLPAKDEFPQRYIDPFLRIKK